MRAAGAGAVWRSLTRGACGGRIIFRTASRLLACATNSWPHDHRTPNHVGNEVNVFSRFDILTRPVIWKHRADARTSSWGGAGSEAVFRARAVRRHSSVHRARARPTERPTGRPLPLTADSKQASPLAACLRKTGCAEDVAAQADSHRRDDPID